MSQQQHKHHLVCHNNFTTWPLLIPSDLPFSQVRVRLSELIRPPAQKYGDPSAATFNSASASSAHQLHQHTCLIKCSALSLESRETIRIPLWAQYDRAAEWLKLFLPSFKFLLKTFCSRFPQDCTFSPGEQVVASSPLMVSSTRASLGLMAPNYTGIINLLRFYSTLLHRNSKTRSQQTNKHVGVYLVGTTQTSLLHLMLSCVNNLKEELPERVVPALIAELELGSRSERRRKMRKRRKRKKMGKRRKRRKRDE